MIAATVESAVLNTALSNTSNSLSDPRQWLPTNFEARGEIMHRSDATTLSLELSTMRALAELCLRPYGDALPDTTFRKGGDTTIQIQAEPKPRRGFEVRHAMWGLLLCGHPMLASGRVLMVERCKLGFVTESKAFHVIGILKYAEVAGMLGLGEGVDVARLVRRGEGRNESLVDEGESELMVFDNLGSTIRGQNSSMILTNASTSPGLMDGPKVGVKLLHDGAPLKESSVFFAFWEAMIDRAAKARRTEGIGPYSVRATDDKLIIQYGPVLEKTPTLDYDTVIKALSLIPRFMAMRGEYTECDFKIYEDNKVVGRGSVWIGD